MRDKSHTQVPVAMPKQAQPGKVLDEQIHQSQERQSAEEADNNQTNLNLSSDASNIQMRQAEIEEGQMQKLLANQKLLVRSLQHNKQGTIDEAKMPDFVTQIYALMSVLQRAVRVVKNNHLSLSSILVLSHPVFIRISFILLLSLSVTI